MIPFVLAIALVELGAWFFGTYYGAVNDPYVSASEWRAFFLPVVALPTVSAWIAAEIAVLFRRPSLFVRREGRHQSTWLARLTTRFALGLLAGGLILVVEGVGLAINAETISDLWIMGLCPFLVVGLGVAFLPRYTPAKGCPTCGYDWRGLDRCPECGTVHANASKSTAVPCGNAASIGTGSPQHLPV
ncbi:MAG: hypothetical protein AB7Q00_01990 [Phycisphaerales bacterium]